MDGILNGGAVCGVLLALGAAANGAVWRVSPAATDGMKGRLRPARRTQGGPSAAEEHRLPEGVAFGLGFQQDDGQASERHGDGR